MGNYVITAFPGRRSEVANGADGDRLKPTFARIQSWCIRKHDEKTQGSAAAVYQ